MRPLLIAMEHTGNAEHVLHVECVTSDLNVILKMRQIRGVSTGSFFTVKNEVRLHRCSQFQRDQHKTSLLQLAINTNHEQKHIIIIRSLINVNHLKRMDYHTIQ